jgi:hypothetical protein
MQFLAATITDFAKFLEAIASARGISWESFQDIADKGQGRGVAGSARDSIKGKLSLLAV